MVRRRVKAKMTARGKEKLKKKLLSTGLEIERAAKQNAPVDTGRLRSSITTEVMERRGIPIVKVGTNLEYAPAIEFGVEPFIITPDQAEALQWTDPDTGEPVFATRVEHPGFPEQPFLLPAVDEVMARYNRR